jgi:hypothetical protein
MIDVDADSRITLRAVQDALADVSAALVDEQQKKYDDEEFSHGF